MDFKEMIFDIYFYSMKIQDYSSEISGLEFADERSNLNDSDVDKLRRYKKEHEASSRIAEFRLQDIRQRHRDDLVQHLHDVIKNIHLRLAQFRGNTDKNAPFEIMQLEDLIVYIRNIEQGVSPKYSVWWVFYFITTLFRQNKENWYSGKNQPEDGNRVKPICPSCSFENDITTEIDIFIPLAKTPYEKVTILDEYACTGCKQRYRVMFEIHLKELVEFKIIDVSHPPVSFTW